jgi:hypothetical protein
MERAFNRHKAVTRVISGVYGEAYKGDAEYEAIQKRIAEVAKTMGRKPHILVAKMGQDGHDRGAKVIATAFADMGFTVDLSDMFETPEEVAEKAKAMGVDVVGVSSLAAGHLTLVPELIDRLKADRRRRHQGRLRRRHPRTGLRRPARRRRGGNLRAGIERAGSGERRAGAGGGGAAEPLASLRSDALKKPQAGLFSSASHT